MSKQKMSAEDKKMVNGLFWNSFLLEASYNYERQQALGFSVGMWPAIKRFYKTKEGQAEALKRHMAIFNTTPHMVSVISGVTAAMEKEASENKDFDKDIINNVKVGLMGPLAGIGDSFFWGTLRIIAAGIGLSLAQQGSVLGAILFLIIFNVPHLLIRYYRPNEQLEERRHLKNDFQGRVNRRPYGNRRHECLHGCDENPAHLYHWRDGV